MAELNTPQGPDADTKVNASSRLDDLIDAADEKIASGEDSTSAGGEVEAAQATVPSDEDVDDGTAEEPEGNAPEGQPESEAQTEPDAATPQGDPFTPEEETLLRRSQATAEDIEYYRSLTVTQRNRALNPLRNSVRNTDRLYGLSPEERNREIERTRSEASSSTRESTGGHAVQKITPDKAKLNALAESLGITAEAAEALAETLLEPVNQREAQREQERQNAAQSDWSRRVDDAARSAHTEIAKTFPKLKESAAFEALLAEPETFAVFRAKVETGVDVGKAMLDAARERATVKFLPEINQKRAEAKAHDKAKVTKQTAEPTSKHLTRGPATGQPRVKNLDEAHALILADGD
jgi:alpha-D-ribose 1-methylphosphonate 5-triphosphate synthase subunit PhnG